MEYISIPLQKIFPDKELPGDIYLYINEKYLKYRHAGDLIEACKYNYFMAQNVESIFVETSCFSEFNYWANKVREEDANQTIKELGEDNKDFVEANMETRELIIATFTKDEIDDKAVKQLSSQTEKVIDMLEKKKAEIAKIALAKLSKWNSSIGDHSTSVANLSVFLAGVCGQSHRAVLEDLYLGAMLHDFGKTKIPAKVLENPGSATYNDQILRHPELGRTLLDGKGLSDRVLKIVVEHHEQHDGNGYPNKLNGKKIYSLSKIVAIANGFVDSFVEGKEQNMKDVQAYKKALKAVELGSSRLYDPEMVKPILKALRMSFEENIDTLPHDEL